MDALGKFGEHPRSYSRVLERTLTLFSCSPNFPRASIPRYTHAKHTHSLIADHAIEHGFTVAENGIKVVQIRSNLESNFPPFHH